MKTFLKIIIALFFVIAVAAGIAALFDVELPKFDIKNPFSTETETETSTDADETPSDTSSSGDSVSTDIGSDSGVIIETGDYYFKYNYPDNYLDYRKDDGTYGASAKISGLLHTNGDYGVSTYQFDEIVMVGSADGAPYLDIYFYLDGNMVFHFGNENGEPWPVESCYIEFSNDVEVTSEFRGIFLGVLVPSIAA